MRSIDLARAIYASGGNPLEYPSAMPDTPALVAADQWLPLRAGARHRSFATDDGVDLDTMLRARGSAPSSARFAQVAFGAHRNIANIAWKLARHAEATGRPASRDFVILPAALEHADVVACNVSSGGHVYSGLLMTDPNLPMRGYLKGLLCPVSLLLLDREQTEAMHDMAGIPRPGHEPGRLRCDVAVVSAHLPGGATCMALTYGVAVPFLGFDDRPVGFSAVATAGRSYPSMTQQEMFRAINARLRVEPEEAGVVPIADAFNRRRRALIAEGPAAARRIPLDPLFAGVRDALSSRFALADEDGVVRRGFEDVLVPLGSEAAWSALPVFAPEV